MTQIGTLVIPPELKAAFNALISIGDNRNRGVVRKIGYLQSRAKILNMTNKSLLPQVSALWAGLTIAQKNDWKLAGLADTKKAFNLFTQDTCYRLKHGIAGIATPSIYHQFMVGRLEINASADHAILAQFHPHLYYKLKKMAGSTTIMEDVAINETLVLPLTISASFRCNIVPTSAGSRARFYAIIYSSYQGRTIETEIGFNCTNQASWTRGTSTATEVVGVVRSYDLRIELVDCRGWVEWDNVTAEHTGTNWARDYRCNDVNNELTKINYQIEKSWEEQALPTGGAFSSVYPTD